MIIVSHRGNIDGPDRDKENRQESIDQAISLGYDVEIDVRLIDGNFFLGHDGPDRRVDIAWLRARKKNLWIHCKNLDAVVWFKEHDDFRYFWHQEDHVTLTSKGDIWAYPGFQPIRGSIAVMPELKHDRTDECAGICTDYPKLYSKI